MQNSVLSLPNIYTLKLFTNVTRVSEVDKRYLEKAYETWREVWQDVYKNEMGLNSSLYSNEFSRQTYVLTLFQKEVCIGVAFMREIDLSSQIAVDDSYFRFWPKEILDELRSEHQRVMLASNFTIAHAFRQSRHFEWKTLFFALYKDFYNTLDAKFMITAGRKVRANEKLCYDVGGVCLKKDVPYKSESLESIQEMADILYWKPNIQFSLLNPELQKLREEIWQEFQRENHYELLSA